MVRRPGRGTRGSAPRRRPAGSARARAGSSAAPDARTAPGRSARRVRRRAPRATAGATRVHGAASGRTVEAGRPSRAAIVRKPAPFALAASALPITSVLSAGRTVSAVGNRTWVPGSQRSGPAVGSRSPCRRPAAHGAVRPCPYGRSLPRQRGQLILPACRIRSARWGHDTRSPRTTPLMSRDPCLPHPARRRGQLVLH